MNPRILNKIITKNFRFLSTQHSLNNNINYNIINSSQKNKNGIFGLCFSKYTSQRYLCRVSAPLYISFQRRNLSSEAGAQQNSEKLLQAPLQDMTSSEAFSRLPTDNLPDMIKVISESKIVELAQQILLKVHETTGLPWWASIALTAFVVRASVTLPFTVIQLRNTAKLELLQPEMKEITKRCKREASYAYSYHGWSESLARQKYRKDVRAEWNELIVRDNCHPFKSYVLLLIQLPVWFSFSFATRNLSLMLPRGDITAEMTYFEMMVGGFGWVKNLTDLDHYMILPIILTLVNLSIIEANVLFRDQSKITTLQKWQRNFFRVLTIVLLPIAMYVPSGTVIYWISSSSIGLFQTFLFHSIRVRRLIGVPVKESHPYHLFFSNLKSKLHLASK